MKDIVCGFFLLLNICLRLYVYFSFWFFITWSNVFLYFYVLFFSDLKDFISETVEDFFEKINVYWFSVISDAVIGIILVAEMHIFWYLVGACYFKLVWDLDEKFIVCGVEGGRVLRGV